jgi:hypothetical protein
MINSVSGSDLLISLAGSTIFWVTVSGMAVRGLHIDFKQLESFLEDTYHRADSFSFSILPASKTVAGKILTSLYGPNHSRIFLVTLIACLSINALAATKMRSDWLDSHAAIENNIANTVKIVSPSYYSLAYSETGRGAIQKAFAQGGTQGAVWFINHDADSLKIREVYDSFYENYQDVIFRNGLYYDDFLELMFGTPHSNAYWIGHQTSEILALLALTIAFTAAIDTAATYATVAAYTAATSSSFREFGLYILIVFLCFIISFVNYYGAMHGKVLGGLMLLFILFFTALFLVIITTISVGIITAQTSVARQAAVILLFFLLGVIGRHFILAGILEWWHIIAREFSEIYIALSDTGSIVMMMSSMPALYPAVALLSVVLWISICKLIFMTLKQLLLGQIYGASIMSGGTFFIGFLTTIISSTTVMLFLWATFRSGIG